MAYRFMTMARLYSLMNEICRNPVVKTPCQITAAASFLHDVLHMIEMATAIGRQDDVARYTALLTSLKSEFHTAFWNPVQHRYSTGTQVAQAVALWLEVVPEDLVGPLVAGLADEVATTGLTVGFIGVRYLFEALARANRTDAALRCLLRTTYPGYGYEIFSEYEPSSSLWESWDGDTMKQWLAESSRNHHYQASINTFLRKYVVGLDQPTGTAGWATVRFRPEAAATLPADLAAALPGASVTLNTHRGRIYAGWKRLPNGTVQTQLEVPAGSVGEVHVPLPDCSGGAGDLEISEQGAGVVFPARRRAVDGHITGDGGVSWEGGDPRFSRFHTLSGSYVFVAQCRKPS